MKQKICHSMESSEEKAVADICSKLGSAHFDVILFYSSIKYDFDLLTQLFNEKFSGAQIMGSTSCGEISTDGYTTDGIVVAAISCPGDRVKGMIFDDAAGALYVHKKEIEECASSCNIRKNAQDAFALTFITGLYNAEENVLAVLHTVLGADLPVVGGSAGDDLQFKETKISYNGRVSKDGAAILLFHPTERFLIYRENIFMPTGKRLNITKADVINRKVITIDNQNPLKQLAHVIGMSESQVRQNVDDLKVGRTLGKEVFISAIQQINSDGTINFFSRLMPKSQVEYLEPVDPVEVAKKTCKDVLEKIPNPGVIFMSNCIQRTLRFKSMKVDKEIISLYNTSFKKNFSGFTTYGEQINRIHSNSTLVILAVEE